MLDSAIMLELNPSLPTLAPMLPDSRVVVDLVRWSSQEQIDRLAVQEVQQRLAMQGMNLFKEAYRV